MNLYGLQKLSCPICKSDLSLVEIDSETIPISEYTFFEDNRTLIHEHQKLFSKVVKNGLLLCDKCHIWYPIYAYVPILLVFRVKLHRFFADKFEAVIRQYEGYEAPNGSAKPGERSTQKTFSEEWNALKLDELTFNYTKEERGKLHGTVYLKWSGEKPEGVDTICNVGCGFGRESEILYETSNGAEVFGVDLNLSLLNSSHLFRKKPLIHLIIASAFNLPFKEASFDLVYSQGVLHHTYSTHEAVQSIARFVKPGKQLFVWVYSRESLPYINFSLAGMLSFFGDRIIRPILSRSPAFVRNFCINALSLLIHPLNVLGFGGKAHRNKWKLQNTRHSMRDWLTPRYAHTHKFVEVIEWFEDLGFNYELASPSTFRRALGRELSGIGILGRKIS